MNKFQVLVIEDDEAVLNLISTTLETQNYRYHTASNGTAGILSALSNPADVILLDLGLPDMDGVDVIRKIRGWSSVPIIVVSARDEDSDKVAALDEGADDYLTKPFSVTELLARLRVALRRVAADQNHPRTESSVYCNGELRIDYSAGCVFRKNTEIHLTPNEYRLLCLLAKNTGKVLTYRYIENQLWGSGSPEYNATLRVFVATLRRKIEVDPSMPQYIQTHIGIGYRMLENS
jgi:two-component system KDP operon response regulator KdpE